MLKPIVLVAFTVKVAFPPWQIVAFGGVIPVIAKSPKGQQFILFKFAISSVKSHSGKLLCG